MQSPYIDMSIRNKILLPFVIVFAVLFLVFLYRMIGLNSVLLQLERNTSELQKLNDITNQLSIMRQESRQSVVSYYASFDDKYLFNIKRDDKNVVKLMREMRPLLRSERGVMLYERFKKTYDYVSRERTVFLSTLRSNDKAIATPAFKSWERRAEDNYAALLDLSNYNLHSLERGHATYKKIINDSLIILLAIIIATFFLIIAFYFYLNYLLIKPVSQVRTAANSIANGDFDTVISINTQDEVGSLSRDLQLMASKLKKSYAELQTEVIRKDKALKRNKELEAQKDNFLAIASHELKTPVTSIKAYGQVLQKMFNQKGDTIAVAAIKKMDAQINKLTVLISDLLDVTKIQSGKLYMNLEYFNFNELLHEIVDELQVTATKHRLVKEFGTEAQLFGDRDRTGQVITNFITNAIKYSPEGGDIFIRSTVAGQKIILGVQDFGIGIPKDEAAKVFERFYRVTGSKHNTIPGLGLGLYISSEIIKRQGGKIWVESTEGKGSTFFFSLPLKKKQRKTVS